MGGGMAANLLKAGFSLTVYNRTAAKAEALVKDGARLASTPAEAVTGASIVIGMLADDTASREVWAGKQGALQGVQDGAILIDSSTVSPCLDHGTGSAWVGTRSGTAGRSSHG